MRAKIVDGIVYSPYPDLEDLRDVSMYAFLTQRLQKYGHKTAMVHGQDKVSYSEFLERLKVMASGFHSHGIGTGDRVLVHVENGIDSFVAACSIPLTGATLVTSDVTFNEEELLDHARRTDATHLLTGKAYVDIFDNLSTVVNFKSRFSLTDAPGYINAANFANDGKLKHTEFPNNQVGVKFVCHSTGTTGISKIIEITEATFLSQISCREKFQLARPEDVCIGGGNISFYVCFTYVFFIISIGGTIVLLDKYSPVPDVFAALRDHQVNLVHGTPTKILEIVHEAEILGQSFPLVKKFTTLGTPMTEMARSAILAACSPSELRSCYGMTEVSGYLAAPPSGEITAGDVGFPVPGARMKIVDPVSGVVLSHNQKGEVLFHTPHIMVGYYKNPEETASFTTDDGWIRTGYLYAKRLLESCEPHNTAFGGPCIEQNYARSVSLYRHGLLVTLSSMVVTPGDLGYYNEDGRLFVLGRVKAAVSANNVWAGLPQMEECLSFHPSVIEAAVMPNPELPAAIIVIRKDEIPSERLAEKIKTFVKERLPTAQPLDGGIFFVDAIPRSGFGKIKRRLLSDIIPTLRRMDAPCCKSNACAN